MYMNIRHISPDDVKTIEKSVNSDHQAVEFLGEMASYKHEFKEGYFNRAMLAEDDDGKFLGFVLIEANTTSRTVKVKNLYVDKKFRKQGAGKELLKEADKLAELFGLNIITLNVYSQNTEALAFYKKQGYEPAGEVKYWVYIRGQHISNIQLAKVID